MTSIRIPFVSPFPIDCTVCGSEIVSNDVYKTESRRNRYRNMFAKCSECDTDLKIEQNHPLMPDVDVFEVSEEDDT